MGAGTSVHPLFRRGYTNVEGLATGVVRYSIVPCIVGGGITTGVTQPGRGGSTVGRTMMNFQNLVDELADTIGRPVVIGDSRSRLLAASDMARVNLASLCGPERLAVAVRGDRGHLATLWLVTDDLPPLRGSDYAAIDAAVSVTRELLTGDPIDREPLTHDVRVGTLLSPDQERRRLAFDDAVARRKLERGDDTVVYAVDVSSATSALERLTFARRLTATRTISLVYLGEVHDRMMFVGRSGDSIEGVDAIQREAGNRGIGVGAIGTARHNRVAPDLMEAAEQAALAATIVAAIPQLGGFADIGALGPWALLASVVGDRRQLAVFSPGAYALCTQGDETQRQTIEVYLDGVGHVSEVCQVLHIHRATLYYRLERMPAVVKEALEDGVTRSALHLCLKLIRLWEATGRI